MWHNNTQEFKDTFDQRLIAETKDISNLVLLLCDPKSRWCSGGIINANAGLVSTLYVVLPSKGLIQYNLVRVQDFSRPHIYSANRFEAKKAECRSLKSHASLVQYSLFQIQQVISKQSPFPESPKSTRESTSKGAPVQWAAFLAGSCQDSRYTSTSRASSSSDCSSLRGG
jgi:hypothetical protein